MRFIYLLVFSIFLLPLFVWSQSNLINKIKSLPTKEIYDMMVDSKGYVWIAHEVGISRYDGINLISYTSPEQTSLSSTDLVEDNYGRIWFHNFTGQIFYIENEKMHLLKAYDAKKETAFPRIALFNNTLVASTEQGIFICDTKNLACKYISCANAPGKGTTSLAVLNQAIVGYGEGNWFIYRPGKQLKMVGLKADGAGYLKTNSSTLNALTLKDTAFLISNPAGILSKITVDGDSLKLIKNIFAGDFINTVTVNPGKVWVNTVKKSFLLNNIHQRLALYDLTAIKTDHEGNTWYSSLKDGVMVKYRTLPENLSAINIAQKGDLVKCIATKGGILLAGTQNSSIIVYDTREKRILKNIQLPDNPGVISYLYNFQGNKYLAATSVNTYEVDIEKKSVAFYPYVKTLKQAYQTDRFLLAASAKGLIVIPSKNSPALRHFIEENFKGLRRQHDKNGDYFDYNLRCRAVCYNSKDTSIFVAFKDGLHVINKKGIMPFLYNNQNVYATCLSYINGKVIVGTINNGVLITDGIKTTQVNTSDGLSTNNILNIKKTSGMIWLVGTDATSMLDSTNFKTITDLDISALTDKQLLDIGQTSERPYVATTDGLYAFSTIKHIEKLKFKNHIQSVLVNNQPIPQDKKNRLTYYENNIEFNLTVPFYYHANDIYFKYLLEGANNKSWQVTNPGERNIAFSELSPGDYKFTAFAIHPQFGQSVAPVYYKFSISEKWWQGWLFKISVTLAIALLISYLVASYLLNRLRIQKALYEQKLTIQNERQRISSEMHDDVGAGLSAVKLFLSMSEYESDPNISQMGKMINDISENIKQIIWSTNAENDTLESLIYYIQYQATNLFKHSKITFNAFVPLDIPAYTIAGETRRNIYLLTLEFLHNALKHSNATAITLELSLADEKLLIKICDNGIGFEQTNKTYAGMGLKNAKTRIDSVKGKTKINSGDDGTTVLISIAL